MFIWGLETFDLQFFSCFLYLRRGQVTGQKLIFLWRNVRLPPLQDSIDIDRGPCEFMLIYQILTFVLIKLHQILTWVRIDFLNRQVSWLIVCLVLLRGYWMNRLVNFPLDLYLFLCLGECWHFSFYRVKSRSISFLISLEFSFTRRNPLEKHVYFVWYLSRFFSRICVSFNKVSGRREMDIIYLHCV